VRQKALWREIVKAAPEHVLRQADRHLVEMTVRLLELTITQSEVSGAVWTQLRQCLAELGMSPSARSRLSVAEPAADNPFEGL
jgi:hypothetical protein